MCGKDTPNLRERLQREDNLTRQKCVQICRATELSRVNSKTIEGRSVEEINNIKQAPARKTVKDDERKAVVIC